MSAPASTGLRFAVLCNRENGSPKVLGQTLTAFLERAGHQATLSYELKAIRRLLDGREAKVFSPAWGIYRAARAAHDARLLSRLREMDAIVLCGTTPRMFHRHACGVERLRELLHPIPVIYYSVQYLGNAPSLVERLERKGEPGVERFEHHWAVSPVTEIRGAPGENWTPIGLHLESVGLRPEPKPAPFAVVDFARKGFEAHRALQVRALEAAGVPYLSLERRYSMAAIRDIYRRASLFFLQFPESFGMPIAECLATGTRILTPDASWPMAWRLDAEPRPGGGGRLGAGFTVYEGFEELVQVLRAHEEEFDPEATPRRVFSSFERDYPGFFRGDLARLREAIGRLPVSVR